MENKLNLNSKKLAISGLLGAVTILLGLTPLGFIPIGPTRATIMHIPVIIGAITQGPIVGALVGLIFGLFSMYQAVMTPTITSFAFLNPLIAIVPRILIGITSYYTYVSLKTIGENKSRVILNILWGGIITYLCFGLVSSLQDSIEIYNIIFNLTLIILTIFMIYISNKNTKTRPLNVVIAAIVGTITNTFFVLGGIYLLYAEKFVEALGQNKEFAGKVIATIGITNGIPEIIAAVLIVSSIINALRTRKTIEF